MTMKFSKKKIKLPNVLYFSGLVLCTRLLTFTQNVCSLLLDFRSQKRNFSSSKEAGEDPTFTNNRLLKMKYYDFFRKISVGRITHILVNYYSGILSL